MKEQMMLINLTKNLISDQTTKLNDKISKLNINITETRKIEIFKNIQSINAKLKSRISQLNTIFEK